MVEYGVIVTNKFGTLNDDENEDPEVILKKAEAASKKEEKTASQKKADRHAAARKKKETAALKAAVSELEKKKATLVIPQKVAESNKENRPEVERGRGRRRFRGFVGQSRDSGAPNELRLASQDIKAPISDVFAERFGEFRGRPRIRGFRGGNRGGFRRGGFRTGNDEQLIDPNVTVNGIQNGENAIEAIDRGSIRTASYGGGFGGRANFRRRFLRGGRQSDRTNDEIRTTGLSFEKRDSLNKANEGAGREETIEDIENNTPEDEKMRKENIVLNEKNEEEQRTEMENDVTVKQLTLDEFKAQTAAKRSEPQFNIRKAGEGANEKEFGKLIPLPKREIVEEPVDEIVVVRREPRTKRLDIEINFTDEQRGRGGGRVRDGFRGGRSHRSGRGDGRGFRQNLNFEVSADAFPALGSY